MVTLGARWTAELQQVSDDVPETAGWQFHLLGADGKELHTEEHPVEDRDAHLIDVGAGTYTLKAMRLDDEGHEFGEPFSSAPFEVKAGTVLRLVMTSLQLFVEYPEEPQ